MATEAEKHTFLLVILATFALVAIGGGALGVGYLFFAEAETPSDDSFAPQAQPTQPELSASPSDEGYRA